LGDGQPDHCTTLRLTAAKLSASKKGYRGLHAVGYDSYVSRRCLPTSVEAEATDLLIAELDHSLDEKRVPSPFMRTGRQDDARVCAGA
jgi:hypothetical protein